MSTSSYPSSEEEQFINGSFNNTLVVILLAGVYTIVYVGTLYMYLSRKSFLNWRIIGTISLSYLVYIGRASFEWYMNKVDFVNNGDTRETVFDSQMFSPVWKTLIFIICNFLTVALADGLLIWRCFHVWNGSRRAISIPLFLLLSEIAIYLTVIIMACANLNLSNVQTQNTLDNLLHAALITALATNVVTTLLVSYRIHSFTDQNILRGSKARLKHIQEILMQSAAVYTIFSLAYTISTFIPFTTDNPLPLLTVQAYMATFYVFTAGIVPTIMVARFSFAPDTSTHLSAITHISGLDFHVQSTSPNTTQSRRNINDTESGGSNLLIQGPGEDLSVKEGGALVGS